ncbi:ChbG/HpnK family deacetylase [Cupriavidus metallidurans]|jgi:predicted glycoside hydrolase/deacetylase ChbG (UPF0249 family)|uniref:ChbG/HpnK family deacetylase n=1 Tax=Cupriavidus TaxID=106589 RepID=UPI0002A3B920|nr:MULTISPECIES: ChbG/HpnK family deacetylase [Cupriavidus]EKZ97847.1 hypothetical protein D769_18244 [Cupriavidus sp. HMR-1]GMG92681.1 hydrolase [Cupriavidus sp. TKC]HBD36381.1 ChbG/HpnK family deacetylase [Cupriavidus sp.]HBO80590.1 ChbG/HpnK family deacetylase [Cupriavidus sp.]
MKGVIINADDFGYDDDTFQATVACFDAGLLTSATILAGSPATASACQYARDNHSRFSFGLHFNIVEGRRPHGASSTLCRKDGSLFPPKIQRARAMAGLIDAADIRREFRLQLDELRDHGVNVSHVDGHGHLHKYPAVMRVLRDEMLRAGIERVRPPQNCYFLKNHMRGAMNVMLLRHFNGLRSPDFYVGADTRQQGWALRLPAMLPEGVTEMSVHPGFAEPWRREEGEPLMHPTPLATAFRQAGVVLMRYHDI